MQTANLARMTNQVKNVVVVEDDGEDFEMIRDLLIEAFGPSVHVEWVSTSVKACDALKSQVADVYLVDNRLDEKSGIELLDELQELELPKPVILLTGQDELAIDLEAMDKGADDYLPKQILTSKIIERSIRYSIKQSESRKKLRDVEQLKAQAEAAEKVFAVKSQFLSQVSHELRTPLTAILGFAEIALDIARSVEDKNRYLEIIKRNGEHLLSVINNFLDLSKLEFGAVRLNIRTFSVLAVVDQVLELMMSKALAKGLGLEIAPASEDFEIENDPFVLRQILFNLVGNAIKFTNTGKVTLKCSASNSGVEIQVQDTGIGINETEKKNLFQPFRQLDYGQMSKSIGSGLGLHLSRQFAQTMSGELNLISSSPGCGSLFSLLLPFVHVANDSETAK